MNFNNYLLPLVDVSHETRQPKKSKQAQQFDQSNHAKGPTCVM